MYAIIQARGRQLKVTPGAIIEVDGTPETGSWGDRTVSVTPGRHEVKVYFKYLTKARCCEASATVDTANGQAVAMEYRTPMMMTAPGRLSVLG